MYLCVPEVKNFPIINRKQYTTINVDKLASPQQIPKTWPH